MLKSICLNDKVFGDRPKIGKYAFAGDTFKLNYAGLEWNMKDIHLEHAKLITYKSCSL